VNVMDEHQFAALKNRSSVKLNLEVSRVKLSTLQNKLPVKGEVRTVVRNRQRGVHTKFIIIKGHINSPPLLSKDTLEDLGMLRLDRFGYLKEKNDLRIKAAHQNNDQYAALFEKYESVFNGIGQIKDMSAKFTIKENVQPVAQKPRPIAYYLQEPLKKWLDQATEEGIFEQVPPGETITWCSPLVVPPKPKYASTDREALEPHMIRACIDLRIPNKYMERSRVAHNPIVEDFTYKFHNCVMFSKVDLKSGYHQLLLDPESRNIATFSTPWGNFRPRRLVFGAKSSQDSFDDAMYPIFGDIPMC